MIRELGVTGLIIAVGLTMKDCGGSRSGGNAKTGQKAVAPVSQDTSTLFFELKFSPSASESAAVIAALKTIFGEPHSPDLRRRAFPAQLYRLGQSFDSLYVMLAYQPRFRDSDGDHWGKAFFAVRVSGIRPVLSPPLDMKDAEYVVVDSVVDVDRDGRPDILFCRGYEGEEDLPRRMAAAYRQGRLVDVSDHIAGSRECALTPSR